MLKKFTALLFLFIAGAILLGHSIIPHHHHDHDHDHDHGQDLKEHPGSSPHHDNEANNDLSHLFSHFIHSTDFFTVSTNKDISTSFSKQLALTVAILPADFLSIPFDIPPLFGKPPRAPVHFSISFAC